MGNGGIRECEVLCCFALAVLSWVTDAAFTGPQDTSALRGTTATLYCRNPDYTGPGLTQWSEGVTFANEGGVFGSNAKYDNFGVITSSSTPTTQLDLQISNVQVSDEGTYECEITPNSAAATLKAEIEGNVDAVTIDGDSSGKPVILRATVESVLRCTARGFRPAVNLEWYKNDVHITTGVSEDAPTDNGDGTFDSSGTLTFTPTRQDNEAILECRTTGQMVAPAKTVSVTLNVQYVPVVSVRYDNKVITCSSDANPLATSHKIILNGTNIVKEFTTSRGSHPFTPVDGCTVISCNATNTVGTGTATFPEEICPGYVEPTTKAPSKSPATTKSPPAATNSGAVVGAVVGVFITGIIICGLTIFCWMRKRRERQKPTRGQSTTGRDWKGYFKPDRQHHVELQRSESDMVAASSKDNQPNGKCSEMILIEKFSVPAVLDMLLIQTCLVNALDFAI
ncbi:cell adhesion molecule 3-like [Acanthaster planci]|uniref:Cell adhesion molecule 3-like n=1 Tax=Acanthaster planci TaxID=133434 RepID=A0A8B7ZZR9_ACAPL|nr:cell adhesion molecule 3-like [Acanthaster planci]